MYGTRREALNGWLARPGWSASEPGSRAARMLAAQILATAEWGRYSDATSTPARQSYPQQNQKDIKKDIEKLFQLASELKEQVEKPCDDRAFPT